MRDLDELYEHRIGHIRAALLRFLEVRARSDERGPYSARDMEEWFNYGPLSNLLSTDDIRPSLDDLEQQNVLSAVRPRYTQPRYFLDVTALDAAVAREARDPNSEYSLFVRLGDPWLAEALEVMENLINDLDAEDDGTIDEDSADERDDDAWNPLPIDRSTTPYKDAIAASEMALREIEGSNGYAQTAPDERAGIVETIKGTLSATKSGLPSRRQIISGLLAPLKYISKKFADASMGETAKQAVVAILKWLATLL